MLFRSRIMLTIIIHCAFKTFHIDLSRVTVNRDRVYLDLEVRRAFVKGSMRRRRHDSTNYRINVNSPLQMRHSLTFRVL